MFIIPWPPSLILSPLRNTGKSRNIGSSVWRYGDRRRQGGGGEGKIFFPSLRPLPLSLWLDPMSPPFCNSLWRFQHGYYANKNTAHPAKRLQRRYTTGKEGFPLSVGAQWLVVLWENTTLTSQSSSLIIEGRVKTSMAHCHSSFHRIFNPPKKLNLRKALLLN